MKYGICLFFLHFLTGKWQELTALGIAQSAERLTALHHVLRMLGF